ncbi:hypothetical protein Barb6XT_00369 [Bacteroidales bacterium Barb6XT]|nr:hypothetical protein Barb6XT_00369 [Bacteroidales bacterium Barb6XT]
MRIRINYTFRITFMCYITRNFYMLRNKISINLFYYSKSLRRITRYFIGDISYSIYRRAMSLYGTCIHSLQIPSALLMAYLLAYTI